MNNEVGASASWGRCALLLIAPWRLPKTTLNTSSGVALFYGCLALGWIFGIFTWFFVVGMNEPFGTWGGLGREVLIKLVPCALLPTFIVAAFSGGLFWFTRRESVRKYRVDVITLSFVPMVVPFTVWMGLVSVFVFSSDVMYQSDFIAGLADYLVVKVLVSFWWLPAFPLAWLIMLGIAIDRVEELAVELGIDCVCACGYDLRGSVAGGSTVCPECGLGIPHRLSWNPPPIHKDV